MLVSKQQKYLSAAQIRETYPLSSSTLRNWANTNKVNCVRIESNGKRFYDIADVKRALGIASAVDKAQKSYCYARVSSSHQKTSLDRQISDLTLAYPTFLVASDIGSGINWQRKGFQTILECALQRNLSQVVVTNRDRLCRFAYPLVQHILEYCGAKIVVLDEISNANYATDDSADHSGFNELAEDLLAITTIFNARYHGRRSATKRRATAIAKRAASQTHQAVPNKRAKRDIA